MPIVDENRLKGNFGAHYVSTCLSSECLVRPVAGDTDVGVDLYCETVQDGQPFLHFWVQVKTGQQCHVAADGESATCSFEVGHLNYWRRQPVPVYAALVPGEWPVREPRVIYLVDITFQMLRGPLQTDQQNFTLRSNYVWRPGVPEDIQGFLVNVVPVDTALLAYRQGVVADVPTLNSCYEVRAPIVRISFFASTILTQIRRTAANALYSLHVFGGLDDQNDFRDKLCSILDKFCEEPTPDPHWETYMARGVAYHAAQKFQDAISIYTIAKRAIEVDPAIVETQPPWCYYLRNLEHNIDRASRQEPPEYRVQDAP